MMTVWLNMKAWKVSFDLITAPYVEHMVIQSRAWLSQSLDSKPQKREVRGRYLLRLYTLQAALWFCRTIMPNFTKITSECFFHKIWLNECNWGAAWYMALSVFNQNYRISSFSRGLHYILYILGLHYIMAVSGDTRSAGLHWSPCIQSQCSPSLFFNAMFFNKVHFL